VYQRQYEGVNTITGVHLLFFYIASFGVLISGGTMLAYLKSPMGYTQIGPYRIYGRKFAYGRFGSTDIPKKIYDEHKNILEEGEYTQDWLEEKFEIDFPSVSFKLSQLYKVAPRTLIKIARCVGIDYIKNSRLTNAEKRALCRSIASKIS